MMSLWWTLPLTIVIELGIVLPWLWSRRGRVVVSVVLINLLTLPLVTLAYTWYPVLWFWELAVIIVEGVLLGLLLEIKFRTSFLLSVVANLTTFLIGVMLF